MKTLKDIKKVKGKNGIQRALVRVDYNVPLKGNKILDTRRIDASFGTITALQKKGFQVVLLAHLGDGAPSLKPIAAYLAKHFTVQFITKPITTDGVVPVVSQKTVVLFENIRRYVGEEKNDPVFAKALAKLGDIFVNDAFPVSHRPHASIVGISKYLPGYAGIQLEKEIKELSKLHTLNKHPFLFILGGAKFETKVPLIKRFIDSADQIVITGAIANSFYKTAGFEVGKSVLEDGYEREIKKLLKSPKLLLPVDVIVLRNNKKHTAVLSEIQKSDVIVDIGSQSVALIGSKIKKAKVIVWNGPTGWYEKGFIGATISLAQAMKESKAFCIIFRITSPKSVVVILVLGFALSK